MSLLHGKMRAFYSQFVKQGDLCFDVGANIGNRTELFLALGARVVAVEPQEKCVQQLQNKYGGRHDVRIINKALGKNEGAAKMFISNASTISSLSTEWISSVKQSGRFAQYEWNTGISVEVTTLDALIGQYGIPSFCKIDVEGYEYQVLQGLSTPIDAVSFEFTPELIEPTLHCISYLADLGHYGFNFSLLESMELSLNEWVSAEQLCKILIDYPDKWVFGDVYAKCQKTN